METIFSHNPTLEELDEITSTVTEAAYIDDLNKRASVNNTSFDFERLIDLQELFSMRNDEAKATHYASIIEKQYKDIYDRSFNE